MKGTFLFLITACTALAQQLPPTSTVCVKYKSGDNPPSKICGLPVPQMPNLNQKEKTGRSANEQYTINFEPSSKMCPTCGQPFMMSPTPEARSILIPHYEYYKQPKSNYLENTNGDCEGASVVALSPIHTFQHLHPQIHESMTNPHIIKLTLMQSEQLRAMREQAEKIQRMKDQIRDIISGKHIRPQENDSGRAIPASTEKSTERINLKTTAVKSD